MSSVFKKHQRQKLCFEGRSWRRLCGRRSPSDFSELSPLSQASCQVVQSPGEPTCPSLQNTHQSFWECLLDTATRISKYFPNTLAAGNRTSISSNSYCLCFSNNSYERRTEKSTLVSFFEGRGITYPQICICEITGSFCLVQVLQVPLHIYIYERRHTYEKTYIYMPSCHVFHDGSLMN